MIAASAAWSTSVTKSLCCFLLTCDTVEVERRAVDDRAGAARGLDGDVEHRMHETRSLCRGSTAAGREMSANARTGARRGAETAGNADRAGPGAIRREDELEKSGAPGGERSEAGREWRHFT